MHAGRVGGQHEAEHRRLRLVAHGDASVLRPIAPPENRRVEPAREGVEDPIHVGEHEHVLLHVGSAERFGQARCGRLLLHEVIGRLLRVADGDRAIGVEIPRRLEPLNDLLRVDRQQRPAGLGGLLKVAAHDRPANAADLGDGFTGQEVDERIAFERLVGLAETPNGQVHGWVPGPWVGITWRGYHFGAAAPTAARGCPCPVAGGSLRASCPSLTACRLRFAILASLAAKPGDVARATPR